jgi:molybdopterin-biosynthesis enzyme MoeA-like protein
MLDAAAEHIVKGAKVLVATLDAYDIPEGRYAADLEAIAKAHEKVTVGSYPSFSSAGVRNQIVLRSRDAAELERATQDARSLIARLSGDKAII